MGTSDAVSRRGPNPKPEPLAAAPAVTPREALAALLAALPLSDEQRREVQAHADALAIDAAARVRRVAWDSVQRRMHEALDEVQAADLAVADEVFARHLPPAEPRR